MQLSKFLPKKFSSRLIAMTFIAGLVPVIIFITLLNLFADRLHVETNRAIQQGQEEQWSRSEAVLRQMAEDFIRQKALSVALQLDLFLQAHPEMRLEDIQKDPKFREIAIQPVGKTGYTAVNDVATAINRFHRSPEIENLDLQSLAESLPEFWSIMEASLDGKYSDGYYRWKEPGGEIRDKYMYIAPLEEITSDGVRLAVAATTYIDEFTLSIQAAQDVSHSTTRYLMGTVKKQIESLRRAGFLFMGLGIAVVLLLAYWMGMYFSRAVTSLREATKAINQGKLDIKVKPGMSGDVGELTKEFNQMITQLATTTVKKEELEASEEKYRNIVESIEEGYYECDIKGTFTFVNGSFCKIIGYSRDEFIGTNFQQLTDEDNSKKVYQLFHQVFETGAPIKLLEWEFARHDGTRGFVSVSVSLIRDAGGKAFGFRGIVLDISDQKRMEEKLKTEKERFETLAKDAPFGMAIIDADGVYEYINPEFTSILGYTLEDIPDGQAWFRLAFPDPEYRKEIISLWINDFKNQKPGHLIPREIKVRCRDDSVKDIRFRSVILKNGKHLVTYEDITETRKLEAQLRQATKMEAIGTLAGGIAHDFNNLLMAIQGNVSLVLLDIDSEHPAYERLNNIQQYVLNGAGLTRQLLGFARGGKYEVKATDINHLIEKSSQMFGRTKKEISIHSKFQEDVWTVEVDRGQIEQVFLNLFVNSWQAMPGGGSLYLETENVNIEENIFKDFFIKPGDYVKISVTDTGVGMDEDTRQRAFDPFFTTKEMSRGTGLGLASVYGIIKNHGGYIDVYSEKGKGTSIICYLPALKTENKGKSIPMESNGEIIYGTETIFLVDDEDFIVDVGKQMLSAMGYQVISATRGEEAVEIYKKDQEKIDMVILDLIMPNMGGGETYDILKKINPDIKVLLSSGYSMDSQATEIMSQGCDGFIQKPFTTTTLSRKIREILDKK